MTPLAFAVFLYDNNPKKQKGCSPARSIGSLKSERSSPTQKVMYALAENEDFDRQEIATYEEVARLMPYPAVPRPIVLIGPPGVGRNELKRRLIALDPDKFRTTIPCINQFFLSFFPPFSLTILCFIDTSRPPKPGEADGVDYHFLDRQQMERDIDDGLFVEFGEYKGNLYGTANRSIKEIIELGYTCILNPHHQVKIPCHFLMSLKINFEMF